MKIFTKRKDGGEESSVTGYWLIEWKKVFSIVLLKFEGKSREAYHTHAFHSLSWVLKGKLLENFLNGGVKKIHKASFVPLITTRQNFHKVDSDGTTWVLSFRGPWKNSWKEYLPLENRHRQLTHGRKEINAK